MLLLCSFRIFTEYSLFFFSSHKNKTASLTPFDRHPCNVVFILCGPLECPTCRVKRRDAVAKVVGPRCGNGISSPFVPLTCRANLPAKEKVSPRG